MSYNNMRSAPPGMARGGHYQGGQPQYGRGGNYGYEASQEPQYEEEPPCCPLCVEPLDDTEKEFFPCPCGYQVCLFCYDKLKQDLKGLCPSCRQEYGSEHPSANKKKESSSEPASKPAARPAAQAPPPVQRGRDPAPMVQPMLPRSPAPGPHGGAMGGGGTGRPPPPGMPRPGSQGGGGGGWGAHPGGPPPHPHVHQQPPREVPPTWDSGAFPSLGAAPAPASASSSQSSGSPPPPNHRRNASGGSASDSPPFAGSRAPGGQVAGGARAPGAAVQRGFPGGQPPPSVNVRPLPGAEEAVATLSKLVREGKMSGRDAASKLIDSFRRRNPEALAPYPCISREVLHSLRRTREGGGGGGPSSGWPGAAREEKRPAPPGFRVL